MGKDDLKEKITRLIEEIKTIGPIMRGTVTIMGKKNKQPYFSIGIKRKTKVMYLGGKRAQLAREYVTNYKKMSAIIDEITISNMDLLKLMKTK